MFGIRTLFRLAARDGILDGVQDAMQHLNGMMPADGIPAPADGLRALFTVQALPAIAGPTAAPETAPASARRPRAT